MRTIFILLTGLVSTLPAFGSGCFDGFYFGAGAGGAILDGSQTGNGFGSLSTGEISNIYISDLEADFFGDTWMGEIYAGFGCQLCFLYAGVEVFGKYSDQKASLHRQNDNIFPAEDASEGVFNNNKVRVGPWHYGIDFRPGILLTPQTLFYGRVGITNTQIRYHTDASNAGILGEPFDVEVIESEHRQGPFLRLGLGIEQALCSRLGLRIEYIYTKYGSLHTEGANTGTVGSSTLDVVNANKVHLRTHELQFGLSYYLGCREGCCEEWSAAPRFCGWYLGGAIGGTFENNHHDVNMLNIAPGPESPELGIHPHIFSADHNKNAFRGLIYGGYSFQFCCLIPLFAGVEIFGQYSPYVNNDINRKLFIDGFNNVLFTANTTVMSRSRVKPWQFGIQARPGVLISPSTLLFGTIGVSCARVDCRYEALFENPAAAISFDKSISSHSTRAALRVGGGLEYHLFCDWHLRADYVYTDYRDIDMSGERSFDAGPPIGTLSLISDSKIHLRDHAITLGITKYL